VQLQVEQQNERFSGVWKISFLYFAYSKALFSIVQRMDDLVFLCIALMLKIWRTKFRFSYMCSDMLLKIRMRHIYRIGEPRYDECTSSLYFRLVFNIRHLLLAVGSTPNLNKSFIASIYIECKNGIQICGLMLV